MLTNLMKLHFFPAIKKIWLTTLLSSLVLSIGLATEIIEISVMGTIFIFYTLLYHIVTLSQSYQINLRWSLLLPLKRWSFLISLTISQLSLFFIWFFLTIFYLLSSFVLSVSLIAKRSDIYTSFSDGPLGLLAEIQGLLSVDFIATLILFIIYFNVASVAGLISWNILAERSSPKWGGSQKLIAVFLFFILSLHFILQVSYSLFASVSFLILIGCMAYFYIATYVLVLPKKNLPVYLISSFLVGILVSVFIYRLSISQLYGNSPNLVIGSLKFLNKLSPDLSRIKQSKSSIFLDYISQKNKYEDNIGIDTKLRFEILSLINKYPLRDGARSIFLENVNFLVRNDIFPQDQASFVDLKGALKYNPDFVSNFYFYFLKGKDEKEIFNFLNEIKLEKSLYWEDQVMSFFLDLNVQNIDSQMIERLLLRKLPDVNNMSSLSKENLLDISIRYFIAIHLLRYKIDDNLHKKILDDKNKLLAISEKKGDFYFLKELIGAIDENQEYYANREVYLNSKSNSKSQKDCSALSSKMLKGNFEASESDSLLKYCYRYYYSKFSGKDKWNLEKIINKTSSRESIRLSYKKLREPLIDLL